MIGNDNRGDVSTAKVSVAVRVKATASLSTRFAWRIVVFVPRDNNGTVTRGGPQPRTRDLVDNIANPSVTCFN